MKTGHFKSRKFTFALIGTGAVLAVFGLSLATMVLSPALAPQIVNLANISIVFLGSVTGVMVGGQSFVDWKQGSSSQFTDNDIHDVKTEDLRESVKKDYSETETQIVRPRDYDSGEIP